MSETKSKPTAVESVLDAYDAAIIKHKNPMQSMHEGYAVLKEEVDELWDAIKADDYEAAQEEVTQVGAMALRFLVDLCGLKIKRDMIARAEHKERTGEGGGIVNQYTTYKFEGNPFQDVVGNDGNPNEGNSTTGYRLEKVQTFTRAQCESAMALQLFCEMHIGGWLQVAVKEAIQKRLKEVDNHGR